MISENKLIDDYNKNGYVIEQCYSKKEYLKIKNFIFDKIYKILKKKKDLKRYHLWGRKFQETHSLNFRAENRFFNVPKNIKKNNSKQKNLLINQIVNR